LWQPRGVTSPAPRCCPGSQPRNTPRRCLPRQSPAPLRAVPVPSCTAEALAPRPLYRLEGALERKKDFYILSSGPNLPLHKSNLSIIPQSCFCSSCPRCGCATLEKANFSFPSSQRARAAGRRAAIMLLTPQTAVNRNQALLKWFIFFSPYNLIISSAEICGRSNELSHTAERSGGKREKQRTGVWYSREHRRWQLPAP